MSRIVFTDTDGFAVANENGELVRRKSAFVENYIGAAQQIMRDSEWKRSGLGAQFTQTEPAPVAPEKFDTTYSGVCFSRNGKVIYSATVENSSGIFYFDPADEKAPEGHVIHSGGGDAEYGDIDLAPDGKSLVTSVRRGGLNADLAVFDLAGDSLTVITSGDSLDENPSYSRRDPGRILFSTKGIGRDLDGNFVRYSNASIASYDLGTREIAEVLSSEKHSLVRPTENKQGELYFIERPIKEKLKKPNIFLEILLIPFRLVYAIYKFLEAFTRIFTGKGFTTRTEGDNPGKQKSQREIVVDGYKLQAEKNLRASEKRKEKFPGYAPSDWVLKKRSPDGEIIEVAKGVIAYALCDDGGIVYTNGKSIVSISPGGEKKKLCNAKLSLRVNVEHKIFSDEQPLQTPFSD